MAEAELREIIEEALEDGAVEPKERVPIYTHESKLHCYVLGIIMSTVLLAASSCRPISNTFLRCFFAFKSKL